MRTYEARNIYSNQRLPRSLIFVSSKELQKLSYSVKPIPWERSTQACNLWNWPNLEAKSQTASVINGIQTLM